MDRPETQYVWSGDAALAYQELGDGSSDLLLLIGGMSNVEVNWSPQRCRASSAALRVVGA